MPTFTKLGLSTELLKAINELGFENPTPIQKKTIPHLLNSNQDLVALAQTGTGKTAAFGLPIIEQIDTDSISTQALILCPTRELCVQITEDLKSYSKYLDGINITPVYGGASMETQKKLLRKGSQIVVGTPGRVLDLINQKKLIVTAIKYLVLDEADEMLSMGFKDALDSILEDTPKDKQVSLFSATMSQEIRGIANRYMKKPIEITVGKQNTGAENVEHTYYVVHAKDRYEALKRITDLNPDIYGIVFCRTREETKHIAEKLMHDGYNADALHGDLSQAQRDQVMGKFRVKHLQLLVATDVAARGLDVTDLTHIINYDMPDELGLYIHRSGRTGRAGKSGESISIIHTREISKINILERQVGKKFERKLIPAGKDVCEKQLYSLVDKVEKVEVNDEQIEKYLPNIYKKLSWLDREELIKHFVSVEFNRFLSYYENAPDLNTVVIGKNDARNKRDGGTTFSRFYINIGHKHKITPTRIIGIINEQMRSKSIEIGKIVISDKYSTFDIDHRYQQDIIKAFAGAKFENRAMTIELAETIQEPVKQDRHERGGRYDRPARSEHSDRSDRSQRTFGRRKRR